LCLKARGFDQFYKLFTIVKDGLAFLARMSTNWNLAAQ
jgi:hypothetical protein